MRTTVLLGAALVILPAAGSGGCGRTELDLGFPDAGQPGGRGGSGGRGGGGGAGPGGTGGAGGTAGAAGAAGTNGAAGATGSAGTTGAAGSTGSGGQAGTAGATGTGGAGPGGPLPIACGQDVCMPGAESCCVQQNTRTCIAATATCGGFSISCLEGAACPSGTICCASLVGGATACVEPATCTFAGGFGLCTGDAQCPASAPRCCRFGQAGVCSSRACP